MQAKAVREDQAQHIITELERSYYGFVRAPAKPWLTPEDRAELRQSLEKSLQQAQAALGILEAQPQISANLKPLRDRLMVLATLAEADLQGA